MDNPGDLMHLCRLCLVKDQVNIPIFEEHGDIRQIFVKISSCLPVKVSKDDQLPKRICDGCSNKLDLLYEFCNTSANSEKKLLSWLEQAGLKDVDTISAVAQHTAKPLETQTQVKQEALEDIHAAVQQTDHLELTDEGVGAAVFEENAIDESDEPPPPKRARRTAAVKAQINITPDSDDDDDDMDISEPMTKVEDESDDSDVDKDPSYVDVPGTSADDQPGPSGVGKDGVEAPLCDRYKIRLVHFANAENGKVTVANANERQKNIDIIEKYRKEQTVLKKKRRRNDKRTTSNLLRKNRDETRFIKKENGYVCSVCDKHLNSKRLMNLHKCVHKLLEKEAHYKKNMSRNSFVCNFCNTEYPSEDKIQNHIQQHEEVCRECQLSFPNAFVLGIHMAEHDDDEKLCCPFCHYKGDLYHYLKNHLFAIHFKTKIFRCDSCGVTYSAKTHLDEHIRFQHDNMDPYSCVVCNRKFIFKSSLRKHQINQHRPLIDGDVPSNYCILCKRVLHSVESLEKHIADIHTNVKPKNTERFVCDICGKDFSHRQSWLLHTKGHSGLKPYKCKLCPKSFKVRAFLTVHEKIHSDEKPFACENCGTCFKRKEGLRRHLQTHTDIKPFACTNCPKQFRRREHLRLHLKSCNKGIKMNLDL